MSPRYPGILLANTSGSTIGNGSDVTTTGQQPGVLLPIASASTARNEVIIPIAEPSSSAAAGGGAPLSSSSAAAASLSAISGVRAKKTKTTPATTPATTLAAALVAPSACTPATAELNINLSRSARSSLPLHPGGATGTKMSAGTTVAPAAAASNNNNNNTNSAQAVKACAGCGARIVDRFLLHAMDRYWHTGCLKCSCCQAQLGEIGTSCFTKAGMILCKNDYIRLFGSSGTCAACSQCIPAQELVMRAQTSVYHVNCFACVTCQHRLVPGDRYSVVNGSLICEQDYPKVLKGHTPLPGRPGHKVNNNNTNINNRNESDMLPYY